MSQRAFKLHWLPPGPRAQAFYESNAAADLILGPQGGGKTVTAIMRMVRHARQQRPSTRDGVRRTKWRLLRDTYRNLWETLIPSWQQWLPPDLIGGWTGGQGEPAEHVVRFTDPHAGSIEMIAEFIAMGDRSVEDVMRGWEGTGVYVNECDRLPFEGVTHAAGRTGRYPPMSEGGPTWFGLLGDCNAPDDDNWVYKQTIETPLDGLQLFRQPSGFSPMAENLRNLPADYYANMARGKPRWWIRRFIEAEFGYSREGQPVYSEFADQQHVAGEPLKPARGIPLSIGADAGGTPALVLTQRMPNGQRRVLDEITSELGALTGAKRFGEALNHLLGRLEYQGIEKIIGWADPSSDDGADRVAGESTWMEMLADVTKIKFKRAPTNQLSARLEAVRRPLAQLVDGQPGLLISPTCRVLRKGFNSGYRYKRVRLGGGAERFEDKPDKNEFSHVHDALQYACLGDDGHAEMTGRKQRREEARARRATEGSNDGYNPLDYSFG